MFKKLILCACLIGFGLVGHASYAADYSWHRDNDADLGKSDKRWNDVYLGGRVVQDSGTNTGGMYVTTSLTATSGTITTTFSAEDQHANAYQFNTGTTATNIRHKCIFSPGIPGKIYVVKNNTVGTMTANTSTGTGTVLTNGKSYLLTINSYPDVVKIAEFSN